jgi:PAS domain S-box-containing protein
LKIAPASLELLGSIQDGFAVLDSDRVVLYANPGASAFFGATGRTLKGHKAETLLGPDHPVVGLLHSADNPGQKSHNLRIESPEGSIFLVSVFRMDREPIAGAFLLVLRDIRQIVEHQERLDHESRPIREITLISGLAHQLRSPLHGMNMRLELLRKECGEGADRHVERLRQEIQRIDQAIGTILKFTRPNLKLVTFDANTLVRELVRGLPADQVTAELTLAPDGLMVRGDRAMVSEAISAVITNALEAMPNGGELRVTTARRAEMVEVVIADNGPGIPQARLEKLFEIDHASVANGNGFGLPFAMRSIELNGGKISLRSEIGRGTTCTISLTAAGVQPDSGASNRAG